MEDDKSPVIAGFSSERRGPKPTEQPDEDTTNSPATYSPSSCKRLIDLDPQEEDEEVQQDQLQGSETSHAVRRLSCGDGGMCDPAILKEVFFPVWHHHKHEEDLTASPRPGGSPSSSDEEDHNNASSSMSPTYQKRGRFLVWPAVKGGPRAAPSSVASALRG